MKPLTPQALRPAVKPDARLGTKPATVLEGVAQDRAIHSLRMGVAIDAPCFHVFVVGPPGTGKQASAQAIVDDHRGCDVPPPDYCFVQNFDDPERPLLLRMPAGRAAAFRDAVAETVDLLRRELPRVFDDASLRQSRDRLVAEFEDKQRVLYGGVEAQAKAAGMGLERVLLGAVARPDLVVRDGEDLVPLREALERADDADRGRIEAAHVEVSQALDDAMRKVRDEARAVDRLLVELEARDCDRVSGGLVDDLKVAFPGDAVGAWLDSLQVRVHRRLDVFVGPPPTTADEAPGDDPALDDAAAGGGWARPGEDAFREFRVNVLLDNAGVDRRPVVVETNPTWANLFGSIDRRPDDPTHLPPDFLGIRAGSLLRASGGFLLMEAEDAFGEPGVWRTLRRTLRHSLLEIETPQDPAFAPSPLKPAAIPVDVKVIVTGDYDLYYDLYEHDPAFADTFKVKAEFDSEIRLEDGARERYASHAAGVCEREGLPPCDPAAVAALVVAGMREVERRDRVTADVALLADWVREAAFLARAEGADAIGEDHVLWALDARSDRHDLVRRLAHEDITSGVVVIETAGERIGQVNALTYFDYGDHRHALPSRITGVIGAGRSGVVSVEREARLSGAIHAKSVLVVMGLLLDRFGQQRPLALAASTVFEQSHDLLDGDSASSAETYAVLSALSGIPIRQGLAVTGAVTQKGEVLAVGGINEKVEGFFDVCASRGLTGDQGVVLPAGNLGHLVLARRVVDAVIANRFRIWAVDSVDEGLEVVTGRPAAEVNERAARRLNELADAAAVDAQGAGSGTKSGRQDA